MKNVKKEKKEKKVREDEKLDQALKESFPASDPVSVSITKK